MPEKKRNFLLLQGPHGPFFWRLARLLRSTGANVWRVGFNAGDQAFSFRDQGFIPFTDCQDIWPQAFERLVSEHKITDLVLYGDTRPIHAEAIKIARNSNITIHVFEEGYMRPYWVTYERNGSNGNSKLMDMSIADMRRSLEKSDMDVPEPPAHWGDMRQHVFYGAVYHWFVMFRNHRYRNFRPHRELPVNKEAGLYTKRLILMPFLALARMISTAKVRLGGLPYHLVLLQLEHDSSFQKHSPFTRIEEFLRLVVEGFAEGAPSHHFLVFKAHPLENDRSPIRNILDQLAQEYGLEGRIHYIRGGKLAKLLDDARTAVTVNSTAAQQVLWRSIPLKVFGKAVYDKPEFVSTLPLKEFFAQPGRPNNRAYRDYRRFLLETSQIPGGFYSTYGRRQLLRQVVDMMLDDEDPYDALRSGKIAPRQNLRVIT